ncbi:DUF2397 family protein [Pseudonocardiaceae bacterium YIM PH 21723]|nr:DUF2397 family protein [Pseudonocardiaceae bacterium YIM PH 21723]
MRLFTSTLLADLSAGEVASAMAAAEKAGTIESGEAALDNVIARLKQLVDWGNLVHGRRETIAASIAEFQHGSVRYQVSKLAVRVQRDVDELLRVPEGAREVSRELLPAIERGVAQLGGTLAEAVLAEGTNPASIAAKQARELLAEQVTTLFLQHTELASTVRDFYAYLGQVVTRHHLDGTELSGFRNLLVDYIQMVVEDVLRYTPTIATALVGFRRARAEMLRLLGGENVDLLGTTLVERARGRSEADWQELTDWFVDRPGRPSQVTALREATARAIGSLLAGVKRATAGGGPLPGRRAELIKLAGWFDQASGEESHTLYAAAFGLHSARHLNPAPEHDGDDEHTPWRDGPVTEVVVSVKSRGERAARGKPSKILDDPMTEHTLLGQARERDAQAAAAVAELTAASGSLGEATLSADATRVLCELLTLAMAQRDSDADSGSVADPIRGLALTLNPAPGESTKIRTAAGTLTLHNTSLAMSTEVKA